MRISAFGESAGKVIYNPGSRQLQASSSLKRARLVDFSRDFDVFIITVRFEHRVEGKREYKTRREIEDLSDVIFEGKAIGVKVENVYIG